MLGMSGERSKVEMEEGKMVRNCISFDRDTKMLEPSLPSPTSFKGSLLLQLLPFGRVSVSITCHRLLYHRAAVSRHSTHPQRPTTGSAYS